ncbi:uncharacterized protein, partial [Argopecten irradians]|uniref:uncharacterized protein n=1 Tax=Argopecten irradians TaxID=31199 RepID=UPI003717A705
TAVPTAAVPTTSRYQQQQQQQQPYQQQPCQQQPYQQQQQQQQPYQQQPFQQQPYHHQAYQQQQPYQQHHQRTNNSNNQRGRNQGRQTRQWQPNQQQQPTRPCQGCGIYNGPSVWSAVVLIILCLPLALCEKPSQVQRLNYGLLFQPTAHLHLGQEYWSHTFEIPLPKRLHLSEVLKCNRRMCEAANPVINSLNAMRTQCMTNINDTIKIINKLIPHGYFPKAIFMDGKRLRRGLFDFIGEISKSLFGTATSTDLANLKKHMQVLNNNNVKLAKAMAREAHELTSFMSTVNDRFDNIVTAVKQNHDQTVTLSQQITHTLDGLQHELIVLEDMMLHQVNASAMLDKQLEHFKLAIHELAKGKLSLFIISPKIIKATLKQIQSIMSSKYPGFHIIHLNPLHYYSFADFLYVRHHSTLYILLKVPISPFAQPLLLFKTYSFPVPINATSTHATQLLNVPDYFVHSSDNQHFTTLSHKQLQMCSAQDNNIFYCSFHVALSSVAKHSCLASIFYNQKDIIKSTCDFRFVQSILKPSMIEVAPSNFLVYHISMLALNCPTGQKIIKGCTFCVLGIPCRCSVTSDALFIPPRLGKCKNDTQEISRLHPVNLALIQEFFDPSTHSAILGHTMYSNVVNISIPKFNIYNHSIVEALANDQKYHLSLKKIVKKAQKGETVFKSLSESMLDSTLSAVNTNWPDTSGIVSLVAGVLSGTAIFISICTYRKYRILSAAVLLTKPNTVSAFTLPPTANIPNFHYKPLPEITTMSMFTDHVYNSLQTPWPYVTLSFLTTAFVLISIYFIWSKFKASNKTSIHVELTTGSECVLITVASLPLCPDNWTITPPIDITSIQVTGKIFPVIHFHWSEFSVIHNHTKHRIYPKHKLHVSHIKAHKIARIVKQPYAAYILLSHHGYFHILK